MKSYIRCLFLALLSAAAVIGCRTPKPPVSPPEPLKETALTPAILERMRKMPDYDLNKYLFILSGPILLNYVSPSSNQFSTKPEIEGVKVGVMLEDRIINTNIMLPKNIKGNALLLQEAGDEFLLRIYFEEKKDEANHPAQTHYLVFSAKKSEKNAFFKLKYIPGSDTNLLEQGKGTLVYGGNTYKVIFDGVTPYLLLWIDQILEPKDESRTLRGRFINTK